MRVFFRSLGTSILVFLVTACFAFFLLEVSLRFGFIKNREFGYRFNRQQDTKIVLIGDSYMAPPGPFAEILARSPFGTSFQLVNLSRAGFSPLDYAKIAERRLGSIRPKIALFSYFVGNDVLDTFRAAARERNPLETLFSYQYLNYEFQSSSFMTRSFEIAQAWGANAELMKEASQGKVNPWMITTAIDRPDFFKGNILLNTAWAKNIWPSVETYMARAAMAAKAAGATPVFVLFPSSVQINSQHVSLYRRMGYEIDPKMRGARVAQDRLLILCKKIQVRCLDLMPVFQSYPIGTKLYFDEDEHLSLIGIKIAVNEIAQFMQKLGL